VVFYNMVINLIIKQLFANLTILVSLLFVYTQISSSAPLQSSSSTIRKLFAGIIGGLLSNILMQYSIRIDTTIIDLRHIPIILLAYYGGALPTVTAMILVILGRFMIGVSPAAYASIILVTGVGLFSLYISKRPLSKKVKTLLMLTFSNIIFSVLAILLIADSSLLISIILTYWAVSYIAGYLAFYVVHFLRKSQEMFNKYKSESTTDGLTGLNNVRKFDEVYNKLINDLQSNNQSLSLLYIDIDFFKKINDTYGHTEGDEVLKELGSLLLRNTRNFDLVSRNGGEEFTVLLLDCRLERALEIAERIRKKIEKHEFTLKSGKEINLTISIGIATYQDTTEDPAMLIKDADQALYQAKNSGRNKVVAFRNTLSQA
jgi:diguanylate cyclase